MWRDPGEAVGVMVTLGQVGDLVGEGILKQRLAMVEISPSYPRASGVRSASAGQQQHCNTATSSTASSRTRSATMAHALSAGKVVFWGNTAPVRGRQNGAQPSRAPFAVTAQQEQQKSNLGEEVARRSALGLMAGAALFAKTGPSQAAYGDAANVFGKATNTTGFVPYAGEGFAILIPSKWNPSREQEFPNTALRYEDNGDAVNNVTVLVKTVGKNSITDFGDPKSFLDKISYLFGDQVFAGQTRSEGGFKPNKVSSISLLDSGAKEKDGKTYYQYELLSRSADGDEGGRHNLISAVVNNGNLYLCKVQAGDKRWFKGAEKFARGAYSSFKVA